MKREGLMKSNRRHLTFAGRVGALSALAVVLFGYEPSGAAGLVNVSLSGATISPTSAFNGINAVCDSTASLNISVTVTPTYDPAGACLNLGGGTKRQATGTGTLSVTATDGTSPVTLSGPDAGGTFTGSIPVLTTEGGPYTITINAAATDGNTSTSCVGASSSPSASNSASAKYVTDQQAPTLTIQAYSPGPVAPSPIPQITAGSSITIGTKIDGGSSGTPYSLTLSAYGPSDLGPSTSDDKFHGPSGPNDNGIGSPSSSHDLALQTECDTTPGIYTARVDLGSQDLCGNAFPTITADPAKTHDGDSGNDTTGQFEVLSPLSLADVTHVVSQLSSGDYGVDQCFTSQFAGPKKSQKVVTDPGSVHLAAIVNATIPATCEASTISNPRIVLTLDPAFSFLLTGKSPETHVFIGVTGPGFDLHTPVPPLTEVTGAAIITFGDAQHVTVDLSNVDVGFGPGVISTDQTIYVRAHASYSNSAPSPADTVYTFSTSTSANGGSLTASSSETIIGNPSNQSCVDGTLE